METRGGWNRGMRSERTQQIINLRRSGKSFNQIATMVGCSKQYCGEVCRSNGLGGAIIEQQLTESQVADYVSRSGFTYVGGYSNAKAPITVKCRDCGKTFDRQFHIFRDVVNGTFGAGCECPICREKRQRENKEQRTRQKEKARQNRKEQLERDAQKRAQQKAEQLSRKSSEQLAKRLATHVCKNCGKEFCQAITGYNSETYCSEKCQKRFLNRGRCEKRYKTLMERKHDKDISLEKLFKRDNGICYLCGNPCDWNDGEDRDGTFIAGGSYPSIDHVIPVSKGGTHTWKNIMLAHRSCNTAKRDR